MARKPNYRFERAERERLQAERQVRRDLRKARSRDDTTNAPELTEHQATDATSGNDLPERRDG
jgi:hypothetical protein